MNHTELLAAIPFLDPISAFNVGFESWWYFTLVPLAFFVSVAYKGVRVRDLSGFWKQVGVMTAQITLGIVGLGVLMLLVVTQIMPRIALTH